MTTSNVENTPMYQHTNGGKAKNIVIGLLAASLAGLGFYTISSNQEKGTQLQQQKVQIAAVTEEKSAVQQNFDASLARLDSMSTINGNLQGQLADKNGEIAKMKTEIRSILNRKNASAGELSRAKKLIEELNGKITGMEADIARLTEENKVLAQEKTVLLQDKDKLTQDLTTTTTAKAELEKKVDVASTLNASNIRVIPINVKGSGKEKVSTTAKKVDKLMISFDVDNRIAPAGATDLYVLITDPDGKPMPMEGDAAATFVTREEGAKAYTAKVSVDIETARRKNVEFGFKPAATFKQGSYKVQIYQNGFLIGESVAALKKGGLFG
jgi:dynactin complex subunit